MLKKLENIFKDYNPYINGHEDMKISSVLIPLVQKNGEYYILFQVRSKNLNTQPNEISFPGGKYEKNETHEYTAIRETCEELGISEDDIKIISPLDLFVAPFNMIIHPYVGIISIDNIHINEDEVDHVFLVPIDYLLKNEPKSYGNEIKIIPSDDFPYDIIPNKHKYKFKVGQYPTLFYKYEEYIIWGITAKILQNFINYIKKFA